MVYCQTLQSEKNAAVNEDCTWLHQHIPMTNDRLCDAHASSHDCFLFELDQWEQRYRRDPGKYPHPALSQLQVYRELFLTTNTDLPHHLLSLQSLPSITASIMRTNQYSPLVLQIFDTIPEVFAFLVLSFLAVSPTYRFGIVIVVCTICTGIGFS
jgi:hypothetical protein